MFSHATGWLTKHQVDVVSQYLMHWHLFMQPGKFARVSISCDTDGKLVTAVIFY